MSRNSLCQNVKKYLIHFANEHLEFRVPEIKSIVSLLGCEAHIREDKLTPWTPFLEIDLKSEKDACAIMNRSVMSKRMYEFLAEGSSLEEVKAQIDNLPSEVTSSLIDEGQSFKLVVESFGKKIQSHEKIKRIEYLTTDTSLFQHKINLSTPDVSFHLIELYENNNPAVENPHTIVFGRWVANGQRDKIDEYDLKKRNFIANTSMDACLSLVMANLAQVKADDFVMDPFVGSGSLLVSSAHCGAYVMGTDIDWKLLHATAKPSRARQKERAKDESVRQNLCQYGLQSRYIDILVADASQHSLLLSDRCRFDAIITDPPYGIRESTERVARKDTKVDKPEGITRYPQKSEYNIGEIFSDLLNLAAKYLAVGGRLVYWIPIYRAEYLESNIPTHPCLRLESNCEQQLSLALSRRLITMVKDREMEALEFNNGEGASMEVNHFENESFRQKYFKSEAEKKVDIQMS